MGGDGQLISNNEQGISNSPRRTCGIEVLGNRKRGFFEEKGRVVNHKNHNELRGFSTGPLTAEPLFDAEKGDF